MNEAILKSLNVAPEEAKRIAAGLARIEAVRAKCAAIRREIEREKAKAVAAVRQCETRLAEAQKGCGHEDVKHHSDPAGGSDSHDECQICGKSFDRNSGSIGYDG